MSRFRKWNAAHNWDHARGPGGKFVGKAGSIKKTYKKNKAKRLPQARGPQKTKLRYYDNSAPVMGFSRLPTGAERRRASMLAAGLGAGVGAVVGGAPVAAGSAIVGGAYTNRAYRIAARNTVTRQKAQKQIYKQIKSTKGGKPPKGGVKGVRVTTGYDRAGRAYAVPTR